MTWSDLSTTVKMTSKLLIFLTRNRVDFFFATVALKSFISILHVVYILNSPISILSIFQLHRKWSLSYFSTHTWFALPVWLSWTSSTMSSSWDPSCQNTRRPSRPSAGALTTQTCLPPPPQTTCSSYGTWPSKKLWPGWTTPKVDGRSTLGFFQVWVLGSDVSPCLLCFHRSSHLGQLVFELVRRGGVCFTARSTLYLGVWRPWARSDGAQRSPFIPVRYLSLQMASQ